MKTTTEEQTTKTNHNGWPIKKKKQGRAIRWSYSLHSSLEFVRLCWAFHQLQQTCAKTDSGPKLFFWQNPNIRPCFDFSSSNFSLHGALVRRRCSEPFQVCNLAKQRSLGLYVAYFSLSLSLSLSLKVFDKSSQQIQIWKPQHYTSRQPLPMSIRTCTQKSRNHSLKTLWIKSSQAGGKWIMGWHLFLPSLMVFFN